MTPERSAPAAVAAAAHPADTLGDWLAGAATESRRGIRLVDRREDEALVPWRELVARARATAGGIQALGVAPGERVGLCFPTGTGFLAAFFGTLLAGAVPAPLPPPQRLADPGEQRRRLGAMAAAAGCRAVLAADELLAAVGAATASGSPPLGVLPLDRLPAGPWRDPGVDDAALGLVQFSSGTTADPKPIALSRGALAAQGRLLDAQWPPAPGEPLASGVSWLPLHHDMGLVGCLLPALARAADLTLLPPELFAARPAAWLRALSRHRATVSPAPSFGYALCLRRVRDADLDGVDLSAWRFALCGSEPVSAEVLRRFAARFAPWGFRAEALMPVYGLAEAALAVTFGEPGRGLVSGRWDRAALHAGRAEPAADGREVVAVGRPLPGFALEVRDAAGHAVAERRVGTVWVRGPSLMAGYLDRSEQTARVVRDGWLDTGDLGFLAGGELYLVGRARDVVILRGRNHAAEEIEAALGGVAGLRPERVAAAGWMPEGAEEEELVLFVERRAGGEPAGDAALVAACGAAVLAAVGAAPGSVVVLAPGSLPVTSSGKLRRHEALRRWLAGELGGAPAAAATGALEEPVAAAPGGARDGGSGGTAA